MLSPFGPERIAQPGQRHPHRHRCQPLDVVREQRRRGGQRGRDGEQAGRPAGQDAGAERRDAKQQAAEQVQEPDERVERREGAEVDLAGVPAAIPRKPSTNCGAAVANSGRINVSAKTKAVWSAQQRLNRRKPARPSQPASSTCLA